MTQEPNCFMAFAKYHSVEKITQIDQQFQFPPFFHCHLHTTAQEKQNITITPKSQTISQGLPILSFLLCLFFFFFIKRSQVRKYSFLFFPSLLWEGGVSARFLDLKGFSCLPLENKLNVCILCRDNLL